MMETILNLVWLGVTLATLWLWRFRWTKSRRDPRHSARLQTVALICFIALIFPVISLTDDLHPEILIVDSVGGKRNATLLVANALHSQCAALNSGRHLAFRSVPTPFVPVHFSVTETIALAEVCVPACGTGSFLGRSPPALL